MNEETILEELLALLDANGVAIRRDALGGGGGGLCTVKGQRLFFLDTQAPLAESAAVCAKAVAEVIDIDGVYIRPLIRQCIEQHSNTQYRSTNNDS